MAKIQKSAEMIRSAAPDETIGRKLRERRTIRRLSLQDVAERSSLSVGLISQIETGATTPSLRSLRQICDALEMPMGWLFEPAPDPAQDVAVRRALRRRLDFPEKGMFKELMSPDAVSDIQMMRIYIEPGGGSSGVTYEKPKSAKCGFVMEGTLGLEVEGATFFINAGDSFAFRASQAHRYWCEGSRAVDLIWVVTPALY